MGSWVQSPAGSLLSLHPGDTSEGSYKFLHLAAYNANSKTADAGQFSPLTFGILFDVGQKRKSLR